MNLPPISDMSDLSEMEAFLERGLVDLQKKIEKESMNFDTIKNLYSMSPELTHLFIKKRRRSAGKMYRGVLSHRIHLRKATK